jgi:hypothetical protein
LLPGKSQLSNVALFDIVLAVFSCYTCQIDEIVLGRGEIKYSNPSTTMVLPTVDFK